MDKETDAFELSDEDFDKVMSGESDEFTFETGGDETGGDETGGDETGGDEIGGDETGGDETGGDETGGDETGDDLMDLFSDETGGDETGGEETSTDEETIELIHNGQLVKVTKAEAVNLAQQGYDYLEKTTRIAPHRKLLDLIDADEELQGVINRHIASKMTPEVTKREDYDTEEEWLQANMTNAVASANPILTPAKDDQIDTGQEKEAPIVTALRARDPENFAKVGPVLKQVIGRLTVEQYSEITSDPQKVVQFYDKVKEHVVSGRTIKPGQNQTAPKKKTFNLRSGQGTRKSRTPAKKNVWDLGNKEFNSVLKKVKGY